MDNVERVFGKPKYNYMYTWTNIDSEPIVLLYWWKLQVASWVGVQKIRY